MAEAQVLLMVALVVVSATVSLAGAQTHHVVGGDRGWDPSLNISSWSHGRIFRVGDKIWFAYSAAQGCIAELGSREEYESCDVSNPIMMLTDGLDTITLDGEGIRYFVSSKTAHCKNGLRLHVEVLPGPPQPEPEATTTAASRDSPAAHTTGIAAGPDLPSGTAYLGGMSWIFFGGLLLSIVGA